MIRRSQPNNWNAGYLDQYRYNRLELWFSNDSSGHGHYYADAVAKHGYSDDYASRDPERNIYKFHDFRAWGTRSANADIFHDG